MNVLNLLPPLGLIAVLLVAAVLNAAPAPPATQELALAAPTVAPLTRAAPTPTPRPRVLSLPEAPKREFRAIALPSPAAATPVPAALPTRTPATATPTRESAPDKTPVPAERESCDPAYPEERTCIPPGPPFEQGCAITTERLFKVLPPDPQRLDHDKDGIGCEPV